MITATATTINAPIDPPTTDLMEIASSSSFSSIGCENSSFKPFRIHAYFQNNFVKNRKGWYKVRQNVNTNGKEKVYTHTKNT